MAIKVGRSRVPVVLDFIKLEPLGALHLKSRQILLEGVDGSSSNVASSIRAQVVEVPNAPADGLAPFDPDAPLISLEYESAFDGSKVAVAEDAGSNPNQSAGFIVHMSSDIGASGTNGDDVINGGAGNEALYGEGGDDTIEGGGGADRIDGGEGFDFAWYNSNSTVGVVVNLEEGMALEARLKATGLSA
ncbi:calcium-binding protein [Microvirga aerophila]|uniref:Calcium-binding protein n=1 Tax=Microvirga aerophila TaxID=670291 RepID=A0A512BK21_9HYPH|nr:calcium-binding protein [Microvirga aerophila]GEO12319.1 hypothetical protein MAE02_00150 [Microvirga aerophila]